MSLALRVGHCSLCGIRQQNEDAVAVERFAHLTVCLVADGMGGGGTGAEASRLGIAVVARELKCRLPPTATHDQARQVIRGAILRANEAVMALDSPHRRCSSTVVLAAWRQQRELYLTHLGDSRAFRVWPDRLEQLTVDDDVREALIAARTITREEARTSRIRNVLVRYLGSPEVGDGPEVQVVPLVPGARFLLATDGLHKWNPELQLADLIRGHADMQRCAESLGQLALASGSRDNVSCVVMEFVEAPMQAPVSIPAASDPSWLGWNDGCVPRIARAIRDHGRFEDMPILADALEDAACPDAVLLAHCREPGTHLPDCWAFAALLRPHSNPTEAT